MCDKFSIKSAVIIVAFFLAAIINVSAQQRVWTESKTGNIINAEFVKLEEKMVTLKLSNGKIVKIDPDRFSQIDINYIDNIIKQRNAIGDGSLLGNVDVPEAESVMREILPRRDNVWKYRTRHFVIESPKPLSDSAQKIVGKAFEVTWEALRAVPLPTRVKRIDSTFKATLILNYDDYLARGGEKVNIPGRVPEAWYSPGEDVTYVCFDDVGLNHNGDLKAGNQQVEQSIIIHEVTHQLTKGCYNPNVTWICEGLACYVGYIPYDGKQLNFGKVLDKIRALYHQPIKISTTFKDFLNYDYGEFHGSEESALHYRASHLLVAYFIHLDGKDGASRLAKYLEESPKKDSDNPPKDRDGHAKGFDELLQGRDINALESSFVEAWKKRGVVITFGSSGKW